jgi:hypothetical protein
MRSTERELAAQEWGAYFASIAGTDELVLASVAVTRERSNGWCEPLRPLHSIAYEAEEDMLKLAVGPHGSPLPVLRYFIAAPRRIEVTGTGNTTEIVVDDAGGMRTRIRLYGPPRLRVGPQDDPASADGGGRC